MPETQTLYENNCFYGRKTMCKGETQVKYKLGINRLEPHKE